MRRVVAMAPILCVILAACGAVNAEAGHLATDRFVLLDRGVPPPGIPAATAESNFFGSFPEQITGWVTYLGKTTDMSGKGTIVVGPGVKPADITVNRFREANQFPYEAVTLTVTDQGHFLIAIEVVNPLDSRITVSCTIADGIKLDPGTRTDINHGRCAGGTTLQSVNKVVNRRAARWNGRDVHLVTTQTNITFSSPITGTLSETNDVPAENQTMAMRTVLDLNIVETGNSFIQHLERTVIPPVEEK